MFVGPPDTARARDRSVDQESEHDDWEGHPEDRSMVKFGPIEAVGIFHFATSC